MLSRNRYRRALAALAAGILAVGVGTASAQPPGSPPGYGPMGGPPGHGPKGGPYGHGPMGGPHGQGIGLDQTLQDLKGKLFLDATQQAAWDAAAAQSNTARETGRGLREKVGNAMRAELAKPEPDFAAVATVADDAEAQGRALRRQVRDQWLKLYATFTPAQKAVVRYAFQQRVDAREGFRERMRQRFGG